MEQEEVIIPMSELMEYIADVVDGRDDIRHRIHMAAHMLMNNLAARGAKPKGGDEDKQELKERIVFLKKNVEAIKSLEEEKEVAQARIDTLVFENGELMENMDR